MKVKTMHQRGSSVLSVMIVALILACVGVLGFGGPVAATGDPDLTMDLEAGLACADFDVRVEIWGNQQVYKEFVDKNGTLVRWISAGKGNLVKLTNLSSGAEFSQQGGSATHVTVHTDGTSTVKGTGYHILIMFPTDVPAGPSTTQYVGSVTWTEGIMAPDGTAYMELIGFHGKTTDICAALSR